MSRKHAAHRIDLRPLDPRRRRGRILRRLFLALLLIVGAFSAGVAGGLFAVHLMGLG